ncbi:MAG: hypothetical protein NVS1B13_19760 [Flavisolibacter sp.]
MIKKWHVYLVGFVLLCCSNLKAQSTKKNPFQRVKVPDSIYIKLEESYKKSTGLDSVNAGKNVWNLLNNKELVFKDGLYSFKGQGPHFPRLLFIYNNRQLYVFSSNYVDKVLQEYIRCIELLKLSEVDRVK